MRHKIAGRTLGRNASHRHAMFRNMAASLIKTLRPGDDDPNKPAVQGRIVTTVAKAKELRPYIEKLITLARRSLPHQRDAAKFGTTAQRNTPEWKQWRESDQWRQWSQAMSPVVAARRKAFALLRDKLAVRILFDELASRFESRDGGYTRVVRIAEYRLGDAGPQALIEFVGVHDRVRTRKARPAPAVAPAPESAPATETSPAEAAPAAGEASSPAPESAG
jgi:large subunit ribosomal protein L17